LLGRLGNLLKQASQLQSQAAQVREELEEARITGSAGDAVEAIVNGYGTLVDLRIAPEALSGGDAEALARSVVEAVRQAQEGASEAQRAKVAGLTQPFGLDLGALGGGEE